MLRLDYFSCLLTIASTVLIGRRKWQGWIIAGVNSLIISVIGMRTAQTGFIPANIFCIAIYGYNILQWRKSSPTATASGRLESQTSITHVPRRFVRRMGRAFAGDERFRRSSDRIRQRSLPHQR